MRKLNIVPLSPTYPCIRQQRKSTVHLHAGQSVIRACRCCICRTKGTGSARARHGENFQNGREDYGQWARSQESLLGKSAFPGSVGAVRPRSETKKESEGEVLIGTKDWFARGGRLMRLPRDFRTSRILSWAELPGSCIGQGYTVGQSSGWGAGEGRGWVRVEVRLGGGGGRSGGWGEGGVWVFKKSSMSAREMGCTFGIDEEEPFRMTTPRHIRKRQDEVCEADPPLVC